MVCLIDFYAWLLSCVDENMSKVPAASVLTAAYAKKQVSIFTCSAWLHTSVYHTVSTKSYVDY